MIVAGRGGVEPEYDPSDGSTTFEERFYPRYLFPMPDVFELPPKCPPTVASELRGAFKLLYQDPSAAANKVRVALERLMDHVGVQTRRKSGNGKLVDLSLHERIELFRIKQPGLADHLMAVKWLGNTGSHEGEATKEDLLDAFELLEHALAEIIDQRTAKAAALAKKLTRKHAPKRRRK